MIKCYARPNSKNPGSREYPWETVTSDGNPWYRQVFHSRAEARKFAVIFNFTQDFKKAGTAFAGCYPLDCKAQHWYDVLLNGRPESTILSHTPELALSEALNAGLKIGRCNVSVAQRLASAATCPSGGAW